MSERTYTQEEVERLARAAKNSCLTYRDIFYRHKTANKQQRMDDAYREIGAALEPFKDLIADLID